MRPNLAAALLGLAWLPLVCAPHAAAGDKQPAKAGLPARYQDVFKTAHTRLAAVYGVSQAEAGGRLAAFSADGKFALTTADDHGDLVLTLWAVEGAKVLWRQRVQQASWFDLHLSADGRRVVGALVLGQGPRGTPTLVAWDVTTGKELRHRLTLGIGHGLALTPDGKRALFGNVDDSPHSAVHVWDLERDKKLFDLGNHPGPVIAVAVSADGKYALSGSKDQTAKLWDLAAGKEVRTFRGHEGTVTCVRFTPGSRLAATAGDDQTVRLWEVATGKEIDRIDLGKCGDGARTLEFAPDGRSLLVGTDNWVVFRFELPEAK